MLIEIVKFRDNAFSREIVNRKDIDPKELSSSDVLAYRFVDENDLNKPTDIYSWNFCPELETFLKPVPSETTPEILFLYKNSFLSDFVKIFHRICNETNLSEVETSNAMLTYANIRGKLNLLSSDEIEKLISVLKKVSE